MIDEHLCCGATDVGRKRESNQDQFLIARMQKSMLVGRTSLPVEPQSRLFGDTQGQLLLVADGMGGHAAGELASKMAIDSMVERILNEVHWFFKLNVEAEREFIESLQSMLRSAHASIQQEGRRVSAQNGMGTTLTLAYLVWPKLYILHAGDSRCYLVRNDTVDQLTTDHTLARRMIDSGGMKPEDEHSSRWSNVLWNVLGGKSEVELTAEVRSATLQPGDTVVLCTDGLHRHLTHERLAEVLRQNPSSQDACRALIQLANDAGGEDNITVIVARIESPPGVESTSNFEQEVTFETTLNYDTLQP